jgi:hypothetical protein
VLAAAAELGRDTYVVPAHVQLGHRGNPPKLEHITGSHLVWADFDHGTSGLSALPAPTISVQSSSTDKRHCYWRCHDLLSADETEVVNIGIMRRGDSDPAVWPRNRLLRLAGSLRPDKGCMVSLLSVEGPTYSREDLLALARPEDVEQQSLARSGGACSHAGGTVNWVVALNYARQYASVVELPDDKPPKAQSLFANDQPLAYLNELMLAAGWIERPYGSWIAVMLGLAASLRSVSDNVDEIAGILYVWRKRPAVMAGGNRSNAERQIVSGIEFAIARAYVPDEETCNDEC